MTENELSFITIGCAIDVHKDLGPGLLESVYQEALVHKLRKKGLFIEKEKPIPLVFEEIKLNCGYRIDIMVENKLIIEVKAVGSLANIHIAQVLTYLKLSRCKLGLLINFNETILKKGIKRIIL